VSARGSGGVSKTVTEKLRAAASPPGSVPVTVIVAWPGETAVTVTASPEVVVVATVVSEEEDEKVRESSSGSVK